VAHRGTVLCIEDNASNIQLIQDILEQCDDVHVLTASDGKTGLEMVHRRRPDVVLLDINLPDIDGGDVLRAIRGDAQVEDTPVIVLTADATERQRTRMKELGADLYLTKPLRPTALIQAVERFLDRSAGASITSTSPDSQRSAG
jgi:CheY-like chemotaxis protein